MAKILIFTMPLDSSPQINQGRLRLMDTEDGGRKDYIWICTSSVGTKQGRESFHQRGGPIPPEYRVKDLPNYWVETKPIYMPNNKGVQGNFYKILPFEVVTDQGGSRGDFGIHLDANVEGSLGCIVMTADRFKHFESVIQDLSDQGIDKLMLSVIYT